MDVIKNRIYELVEEYFSQLDRERRFIPNETKVGVGFPCCDHKEIISVIDSLLGLCLSQGEKVRRFENDFGGYVGCRYGVAVNSGSSANLLAVSALKKLGMVKSGSEVIVPAATFATVVSPVLQNGLVPVFVDVDGETYNMSPGEVENAVTDDTGLILVVHSLGCPADMDKLLEISEEYDVLVMEDCCEAHGAMVGGKKVGSFGLISTYSFFVSHNMTTGEGGIVLTDDGKLEKMLRSIREFGRLDVEAGKPRFCFTDSMLKDYDERYVFDNVGYNVRMTDLAASLGIEQLKKLDSFNKTRVENARYFTDRLGKYGGYLQLPRIPRNSFHSFYGYPILVKEGSPFLRRDIVRFLEDNKVETRGFMGGNLALQPAYRDENIRVVGSLKNATKIMNNAFFIGCHPYIDEIRRRYVISVFDRFFEGVV